MLLSVRGKIERLKVLDAYRTHYSRKYCVRSILLYTNGRSNRHSMITMHIKLCHAANPHSYATIYIFYSHFGQQGFNGESSTLPSVNKRLRRALGYDYARANSTCKKCTCACTLRSHTASPECFYCSNGSESKEKLT